MASTRPERLQTVRMLTSWAPERYAAMGAEVVACVGFIKSTPGCTHQDINSASLTVRKGFDLLLLAGGWLIHE